MHKEGTQTQLNIQLHKGMACMMQCSLIPWMFSHVVASLDVNVATLTVVELFSLVFRFQI